MLVGRIRDPFFGEILLEARIRDAKGACVADEVGLRSRVFENLVSFGGESLSRDS